MNRLVFSLLFSCCFALAACGEDAAPPAETGGNGTDTPYLLAEDVGETLSVIDAKQADPGNTLAVVGRVQEINRDGYAVFYLVDDSLDYCGRGQESCGCKTPWDYCCEEAAMRAARMPVELRDEGGMPVKADDLGLRLLDLIAVEGMLEETEEGGVVLLAEDGWFRRERPALPEGLSWPDS